MFKWIKDLLRKVTGANCIEDVPDEFVSLVRIADEIGITYNVAYYCVITRGAPKYKIGDRWFVKRREFRQWYNKYMRPNNETE